MILLESDYPLEREHIKFMKFQMASTMDIEVHTINGGIWMAALLLLLRMANNGDWLEKNVILTPIALESNSSLATLIRLVRPERFEHPPPWFVVCLRL